MLFSIKGSVGRRYYRCGHAPQSQGASHARFSTGSPLRRQGLPSRDDRRGNHQHLGHGAARTRLQAEQSKRHDAIIFGACILVLLVALAELKHPSSAVRPAPLPVAAANQ